MELGPIFAALRRNKVGAALIALQMAVSLAILCNAIFIVQQRVARTARQSGVDEADDFVIENQWIGTYSVSLVRADVAALRAIPTVTDAYASNTYPFSSGEATLGITLNPDRPGSQRTTAVYLGDQHLMHTLGFKLSAGRNFDASDISDFRGVSYVAPTSGILVTRALADQLAPEGKVLGRVATLAPPLPISAPIVGIIETLQAPDVNAPGGNAVAGNSIVLPYRLIAGGVYLIRAEPGRLAQAMKAAPAALARVSRQRVIRAVFSLAEERHAAYNGDSTVALLLVLVCLILLAVTAFGIVGLTSYWVSQRRRQIGIRRALGATRLAIMRHFQTENLVITTCGMVVGVVLGVAGNLWTVSRFAMARMPYEYLLIGVVTLVALGQLAVLWPALRAAAVPPAVATRTI